MNTAEFGAARPLPEQPSRAIRPARRHRWRSLSWAIALIVVAAAIVLGLRYRAAHQISPVQYDTVGVQRGPLAARVTATGTLSPLVTVSVGSQVSGKIAFIAVDFGSPVKKGQVIATIDPSLFKSAVAQARANQSAAKAAVSKALAEEVRARRAYARAKVLVSQGLLPTQDFETAEANVGVAEASIKSARASLEQAEAALAQAELNLGYCTIRSPIDGVVISRNVDVGQTVAAAFQAPTLFTIAQDLTKMQVDTNVAEADVSKIHPGMSVTFTVDAYPTRRFSGVVKQVRDSAQTIQNVVTYDAVIDVDNGERLLKPSMTATVTFLYAKRDSALRVANAAFRFRPSPEVIARMLEGSKDQVPNELGPDERLIWVVRNGRAVPTRVHIGITDGENTEILGTNLHEGDRVVTDVSGEQTTPGRRA